MNFNQLHRRVSRCERLVESRGTHAQSQWQALKATWRESWTPARILGAGLVGGFLFARARPLRTLGAVSGTRWVQLATSLSGLFASLKAAHAAANAETAANDAETAADDAAGTVEDAVAGETAQVSAADADDGVAASVSDGRRRPDPQWERAPHPAEAATELSER